LTQSCRTASTAVYSAHPISGHRPPGLVASGLTLSKYRHLWSSKLSMSTPAISCRGLLKRYGQQLAVAGIDLDVKRGECFGLLGPNGAGKTTTVEMLEGLTEPDAGHLELLGMRWKTGQDQRIREHIGVQLQETTLADKLEVIEVLRL